MKSVLKSKKFWFNSLTILTVAASMFGYVPDEELALKTSNTLLVIGPLVNLVLTMFFTKKPISITGK